jgi:UDP-N-acetylmuramoylalanine--D-glutamate ligase
LANALAALALGEAVGLPIDSMLTTIRNFHGLTHRCQWVATLDGVDWYNDSKATNIGAAQAAIEGLGAEIKGKTVVIAGGLGKDADFRLLRDTVQRYARALVLIGKDAPLIEAALTGSTAIYQATSLEQAVALARQQAHAGDAVILAPACASFDMFDNFEHRGETFMSLVRALA